MKGIIDKVILSTYHLIEPEGIDVNNKLRTYYRLTHCKGSKFEVRKEVSKST